MNANETMLEAGAEYLYGSSREKAIERHEEDKFEYCKVRAEQLFNIMMAAQFEVTQQKLAEGEPVNNNPLLW
ncbi:MAG TPA: hypothetical protein VFF74_12350 [Methylophilaceae bacterium]|nr:hypothetical protein [Methylophilaceae bacterium]